MFTLNCKGRLLMIDRPIVMGIINATPDSFYEGSRTTGHHELLFRAEQMIKDGASILDVGGQSTRPGSTRVSADEEGARVVPAIEILHRYFPGQILSVDTYFAAVAKTAVEAGASIVNDVSAGSIDNELLPAVAAMKNVPYVLMHMKGTLDHLQSAPMYNNVTLEVLDSLSFKLNDLKLAGIKDVIIDPGFGFGKTIAHNFHLLRELSLLAALSAPILVGLSRKGTIYKTLGTTPDRALNGSTVLHTMALLNGANILRVHDVKEAMEAITLFEAYKK